MTATLWVRLRWHESGEWEEFAALTPEEANDLYERGGFDHFEAWNPLTTPRRVTA